MHTKRPARSVYNTERYRHAQIYIFRDDGRITLWVKVTCDFLLQKFVQFFVFSQSFGIDLGSGRKCDYYDAHVVSASLQTKFITEISIGGAKKCITEISIGGAKKCITKVLIGGADKLTATYNT